MKQFFKFLFASCLGTFIALFLLFGVFLGSAIGAIGNADTTKEISANSVLSLKLDQAIPELTDNMEVNVMDFNTKEVLGLRDIVRSLEKAKTDDDIKGILLEPSMLATGFATAGELRDALLDFRESGKFVISHAPYYSQGAYYLATAAEKVYVEPLGMVDFRGFGAQIPFYKNMLDKLGVKMQIFYAGKFKSATEPFRRTSISPENREQTRVFLDGMYNIMLREISESRRIDVASLRALANDYTGMDVDQAMEAGMVDGTVYIEAVHDEIRGLLDLEEDAKIKTVSLNEYYTARVGKERAGGDRVALIIAEGTIIDGKGEAGMIGDDKYVKLIDQARTDDGVKAVVLRVNSGGGSAMASDRIWKALMRLKETGKPLMVSMGDYAASGGYYIACIGDTIFAEPSTLTGSIGVFSMIPQMKELFNDKIGINFDTVKTGRFSTAFSPFQEWSPAEMNMMQNNTDRMYATFKKRVADGRNISPVVVDSISQGRVWTGKDALDIGLIDRLGDMDDAIAAAGQRAGLEEGFRVEILPKPINPFQRLLEDFLGQENVISRQALRQQLGKHYPVYQYLQEVTQNPGPQMRIPFIVEFQ